MCVAVTVGEVGSSQRRNGIKSSGSPSPNVDNFLKGPYLHCSKVHAFDKKQQQQIEWKV